MAAGPCQLARQPNPNAQTMIRPVHLMSLAPLLVLPWIMVPSSEAQEPPTKAFEQRDLPLSLIFGEWRQKGLNANTYICACDRESCDTRPGWPFRSFQTGQSIPVLGESNLNDARRNGFICGRRWRANIHQRSQRHQTTTGSNSYRAMNIF